MALMIMKGIPPVFFLLVSLISAQDSIHANLYPVRISGASSKRERLTVHCEIRLSVVAVEG